jgi:hypothetical protein
MSLVDIAIPGLIGLLLVVWPQSLFFGSVASPTPGRIRTLRAVGGVLLLIAGGYALMMGA